jgi:hypothetical protein
MKYLKDIWYVPTIIVDNPGCYIQSKLYDSTTKTLNIKEGIREIIQWNYYLIIYNCIQNINTDKHKIYFIDLLDTYAELFDVTYSKEPWNIVFG